MKVKSLLLAILCSSNIAFADTEGYDYYKTSNYVEFNSECFSSGDDLDMYDYQTGNYHAIEVQSVQCNGSGCEIEFYDYEFSEYRYVDLEESMCN